MVGDLLISESAVWYAEFKINNDVKVNVNVDSTVWYIEVEVDNGIDNDVEVNGDGKTTNKKRNTCPYFTMVVVSRRRMTNFMVKVVDTALVYLEEARGDLKVAVESHIDLLWDLVPPSIINFIEEGLQNNTTDILGIFQSLGVILTAPTTYSRANI